jgi:lytic murein transglycosylase
MKVRQPLNAAVLALLTWTHSASAAPCGGSAAGFGAWLDAFKQEAVVDGFSQRTIDAALADVSYDHAVISRDRGQKVFRQSFEKFSARLVTPARLNRGRTLLQRHAGLLRQIEARYGVPGPVLVSIWGLETGFGADTGHFKTLQALATLAYDCRRSAQFTEELKDALKMVQRGDMSPAQMRGDWAGEIGQTQFMPSSYLKYAVDFEGDGRRDLIHSTADALASTANLLKGSGWRQGAGWKEDEPNFPGRDEEIRHLCGRRTDGNGGQHRALGCLAVADRSPAPEPALKRGGTGSAGQGGALPRRCLTVAVDGDPSDAVKQRQIRLLLGQYRKAVADSSQNGHTRAPAVAIASLSSRSAAWYQKREPSFSDAIAAVRRLLGGCMSAAAQDLREGDHARLLDCHTMGSIHSWIPAKSWGIARS